MCVLLRRFPKDDVPFVILLLGFGGRPQERVLCDVRGQVQLRKVSGERLSSRSGLEVLGTEESSDDGLRYA